MLGYFPDSLNIGGVEHKIFTDFRVGIAILNNFNHPDVTVGDKASYMLNALFGKKQLFGADGYVEACEKALWFLRCGKKSKGREDEAGDMRFDPVIFDWEHDEYLIFDGIAKNRSDVRTREYCHFWEFMTYFREMGDCTFTTVCSIRAKIAKRQKLEKWESEFHRKNRDIVDLEIAVRHEENLFKQVFGDV